MLPRSERLSTLGLTLVMEKGRVIHSPLFLLRVMKSFGPSRFAAVAPKKVAKTAVTRNRLRRKIYNAIRAHYLAIVPGMHGALFAKGTAIDASLAEVTADLQQLFVKAGILK